jgi:hypothetical protein
VTALAATLGTPPTQLLTRQNFLVSKALLFPAFRGARALSLIDGSDKAPLETLEVEDDNDAKKTITVDNPAYATWIVQDHQVLRFLLNTLSPDSSTEVWATITTMLSSRNKQRIQNLRSVLNDTKKENLSAAKHFAKMKMFASELAAAGKPLDEDVLVGYLLHGLDTPHYNSLITSVQGNPGTTCQDLYNLFEAYDQRCTRRSVVSILC